VNHDELAADLAAHLRADRRMVWTSIQLGPSGSPRPDVYALFKSYAAPAPMAYEVKVSVADFRADVTAGKWHSYLSYASGVVFAVEANLGLGRKDVPEAAGLIVRGESGWRAAKRPTLNPISIPQEALLKLLSDGVEREGPRHRARAFINAYGLPRFEAIGLKLGMQVAACVRDQQAGAYELESAQRTAENIVSQARKEAEQIRKEAEALSPLHAELCDLLGLAPGAGRWQIQSAVQRLREEAREYPAARRHRTLTEVVQRALENYGFQPEPSADQPAGQE
jgi:DNA repair protein MmcB-like